MVLTLGDPDEVAQQVSQLLEAGLDGLVFHLPNPNDLDTVALAGETLTRAISG
jgi:alkanesulfonate monooxygenase SsuD/methylene tetrahydromethanopterin reductase-like flavin-dependent oxidoreductase (luciferase family)